jgi:FAD synthase
MADTPTVLQGIDALDSSHGRLALVVGVFDGLHRGHRHLLQRLVAQAREWNARPAVVTFDHHPDEVLRGSAPPLLLDPDERLQRLAAEGVEVVVVEHFDDRLRTTPYDVFVGRISERVDLAGFVMTPDAAFGYQRRGTPDALAELGKVSARPFQVATVPPLTIDQRPVSSSAIREAIAEGDLGTARRLLGRDHAVIGEGRETDIEDSATPNREPKGHRLAFAMPVALPPAGRYRARLATFDGRLPIGRGRHAIVRVRSDEVAVPAPSGGRVRVAFVDTADTRGKS